MYDSGITANAFIDTVEEEADISYPIPKASWLRWISTVEQFVYSEVLDEHCYVNVAYADEVNLSDIGEGVSFDDIVAVYVDGAELDRSGIISALVIPDRPMYWTDNNGKLCMSYDGGEELTVVYRLRPAVKVTGVEHVMVPVEWLDMVAARMRGEAYKIANEDGIAGKWLNDYNLQLESFKVWAQKRKERYGR